MSWAYQHTWKLTASPAETFAAFGSRQALVAWFAEFADVALQVGGPYRFWGRHTLGAPSAGQADQRVLAFELGSSLRCSWRIGDCPTEVSLTFAAEGPTTRLVLDHRIDGGLGGVRERELIEDPGGWPSEI